MRNMLRKALSVLLMIATMFSISVQPVMAAPSTAETVNNGLEMIEQNFTDTTIYAKYYLTIDGESLLYTEYGEIVNNTFVLNSTSVASAFLKVGGCSVIVATRFLLSFIVTSASVVNNKTDINGLLMYDANSLSISLISIIFSVSCNPSL